MSSEPGMARMSGRALVDAHVHVWGHHTTAYPFGPHDGLAAPREAFEGARLAAAMDAAGVAAALAIQPRVYGYDHGYLHAARASLRERLRIVPLLNAVRPPNVEDMEALAARDGVAGFRVIALGDEPAGWLIAPDASRLWTRLAEIGLPVGLLMDPRQLPLVETLAAREPGLRVVLDHLGGVRGAHWPVWGPVLLRLSRLPNVYVKISALGHLSRLPFPYDDLHEPVRALLGAYGPERLLWGSDWPHAYDYGTYEESARALAVAIGIESSPTELGLMFGGTARILYGFPSTRDANWNP